MYIGFKIENIFLFFNGDNIGDTTSFVIETQFNSETMTVW